MGAFVRIQPNSLKTTGEGIMNHSLNQVFDNLPKLMRPKQVAEQFGLSRATVYDWHYRPAKYGIPDGMLVKNGRTLLVVSSQLKLWLSSRG